MSTATHESLFLPTVDPSSLITEKVAAAIAKLPDDSRKWAAFIHSELMRHVPYLAEHDVEIVLTQAEEEAGVAFGYAQVHNRTSARPQDDADRPGNVIRIPIIAQDRRLQKFMVFEVGGRVLPLSEQRIEQAMLNPSPFDTDVRRIPPTASLVNDLYPPYQQRQGFGRVIEPGVAGLSKLADVATETVATAATGYGIGKTLKATSGHTANMIAPRGLKTKAEDIAKKTAVPAAVAMAVLLYFRGKKIAPAQLVEFLRKVLKVQEYEAMRIASKLWPVLKVSGGAAIGALGTGVASGVGARALSPAVNTLHDANKRRKK